MIRTFKFLIVNIIKLLLEKELLILDRIIILSYYFHIIIVSFVHSLRVK